jgi:hypothetical protein
MRRRWGPCGLAALALGSLPASEAAAAIPPPRVDGAPYKGTTLTCVASDGAAMSATWSWLRDSVPIPGAETSTYVVTDADVHHRLACAETRTLNGAVDTGISPEVEIAPAPVRIEVQGPLTERGPTLKLRGMVEAPAQPLEGTLALIDLRKRKVIEQTAVHGDGRYVVGETIRNLVVGRYRFELVFTPADADLFGAGSLLVSLKARSPETYPFPRTAANRGPTLLDGLTQFWADGLPCSVDCRPAGAIDGWPLRPFHEQHMLRAGLNELRPSGFHVGIDIMSRDRENVYAIQSGDVHILKSSGIGAHLRVGNYVYWHLRIRVHEGQSVQAYRTVLGRTFAYYVRHLHFSEVDATGRYLNPLRPGGRVLAPWADYESPVIGRPKVAGDGTVTIEAFDPQSYAGVLYYETPVLAPAALAYRAFTAAGTPLTPLEWAYRGSQWLPYEYLYSVFAPGAHGAGFACFAHRRLCIPHWRYRLAGGLAPRLPLASFHGLTRLSIYAWDWAGNITARDMWLAGSGLSFRTRPAGHALRT